MGQAGQAGTGQAGIRLREALLAGRWEEAAAAAPGLDRAHRIELLLGAALQDGRDSFAAARAYGAMEAAGAWGDLCRTLSGPPDRSLDLRAAAWIAGRIAPERWQPEGRAPSAAAAQLFLSGGAAGRADALVAAELRAGAAGLALLEWFSHLPLYPAVALYYRDGTIHALGCRPLLTLGGFC